MTIVYEIGNRCFDPLWESYFRGDFSDSNDIRTAKTDFEGGFWNWYRYFKNSDNDNCLAFPIDAGLVGPAMAAKIAGKPMALHIRCHHQLQRVSSLLLTLAERIVPGSASIKQELLDLKVPSSKLADVVLPEISKVPTEKDNCFVFDRRPILALPATANWQGLVSVIHIAALVYNVRQDFCLVICCHSPSDRNRAAEMEARYNASGMCVCVDNNDCSIEIIRQCQLAINGPEPIDDPLRFLLVDKLGMPVIAGSSVRSDFPSGENCEIIETKFKRQFATALYARLKAS